MIRTRMPSYFPVVVILSLTLFSNCETEVRGHLRSFIENETDHEIQLHYYRNGIEDSKQFVTLQPGEIKKVFSAVPSETSVNYAEALSMPMDSLIVFMGNRKATHYSYNVSIKNSYAFDFDNNRNVFNEKNWAINILVNTSEKYIEESFFAFTEQDYLNAQ